MYLEGLSGPADSWVDAVKSFGEQIGNGIDALFGIGTGRHEADRIVPIQNKIGDEMLPAIVKAIQAGISVSQAQAMYSSLLKTWVDFQAWALNPSQFPDGRAGQGAIDTLRGPLETQLNNLQNAILAAGASVPQSTQVIQRGTPRLETPQAGVPYIAQSGMVPLRMPGDPLIYPSQSAGIGTGPMLLLAAIGLGLLSRQSRSGRA